VVVMAVARNREPTAECPVNHLVHRWMNVDRTLDIINRAGTSSHRHSHLVDEGRCFRSDNMTTNSYTLGIPPRQEDRIRSWLDHLLASGFNTIAFHDEVAVGHASLVLSGEKTYEAVVFVEKSYQRAGIGSLLGEATLGHAQAAGAERVWLRYERGNRAAAALLRPYLEHGLKNYVGDHSQVEITFRLN
jgi:GNAT superfamily N-acetyltransferase